MSEYVIETKDLNYCYTNNKKVLDCLSLKVPKGSIYGFLGPNGAGKSTTMRLLTGILPDDSHAVDIFGKPLQEQMPELFKRMGSLVESPALYLHLSGYNNLKYIAQIRKVEEKRITEILKIVDLYEAKDQKVKRYSLGMKQRLAIAMALLDKPELLLLDEPVNGLDPRGMKEIRELLIKINRESGTTIFVSSHLLSEIEKMCTHAAIISKGKLRFEGTMKALSEKFGLCRISISMKNTEDIINKIPTTYQTKQIAVGLEVALSSRESIPDFIRLLTSLGAEIYEVRIRENLEEWFISLTQ